MRNRVQEAKIKQNTQKPNSPSFNYSKLKIGTKNLEDAVLKLNTFAKGDAQLSNKEAILKAIRDKDLSFLREVSDYFCRASGIYNNLLKYLAFLYRYDWYVTPHIYDEKLSNKNIVKEFHKVLNYLDRFRIKKTLGEIAFKVLKDGCYYGYIIRQNNSCVLQELPVEYCRSRFFSNGMPIVEFNMRYFDDLFKDSTQRQQILNVFPEDFQIGYKKFKKGLLKSSAANERRDGWYLLDPKLAIKFSFNGEDYPPFISMIPLVLDLDMAQELDKKKSMQQLLKIVVQKIPLDKNGDCIIDEDEVQQLHNNAVQMLSQIIGADVLTTFADVSVENMVDNKSATQNDDLKRVERQLYNEAGVSQMQFNTNGNLALDKSILNDEASMYNLLLQFESFLNILIEPFNKNNKIIFDVQLLTTTEHNYKELSKLYKEQAQLGYSKMLPQVALGQTQSSILANAYFENEVLDLVHLFIPPLSSNTMNTDSLSVLKNGDKEAGRPEKPDDQKSEKTIMNKESAT